MSGEDPRGALREAADRARSGARRAVADLTRQRAALEREHRSDPSYGTAARERARAQSREQAREQARAGCTAGDDLGRPP